MSHAFDRRKFIQATAASAAAAALASGGVLIGDDKAKETPETLVKVLFDSLNEKQKKAICFDWDYQDPNRGLLRTYVSNNWQITDQIIDSEFYNADQKHLIRKIYEGLIRPEWHGRIDQQLKDDAGGFGKSQSIAIFGKPGEAKFEMVMTGRHMTLRCDGNSAENIAFGGPIFYGHAARGFNEDPDHPGNVFWEQAILANKVYQVLDGKQQKQAMIDKTPSESAVSFGGEKGVFPGLPVKEMSADQKEHVQKVLQKLVEPYRQSDQDEVLACLKQQGGLDACSLAFYSDSDVGGDKVWDNWRLEGPSFVWYFRGDPHVHVWVNVASDSKIVTNAEG